MTANRVLVIGMLDSIHIARWIDQFRDTSVDLFLIPSTHFRKVHPELIEVRSTNIHIPGEKLFRSLYGYIDYLVTLRFLGSNLSMILRRIYVKFFIVFLKPQVIHAIEFQHAGYLVSKIKKTADRRIITNWGSDIYFFSNRENHKAKIQRVLRWATHYSAECQRDFRLGADLGFVGTNLPRIPNAGGFEIVGQQFKCSDRKLILVKTYGGQFGAGDLAIRAVADFLSTNKQFEVFFYSVTPDLLNQVKELKTSFPDIVDFSTMENPITQKSLMALFGKARIYIGCSKSDGLSTSFLQAIVSGAYPIQTNTSCADELISNGASGSIISPDVSQIKQAIKHVIFDGNTLDSAQLNNLEFSRKHLEREYIASIARSFYD